jgi:hypothetical protein
MRTCTWEQVRARRLARSHLLTPAPRERLAEVVGRVCGIQAQMMGAAELAVGARVDGVTQQDVRAALWERRSLVKTYGPRGTLHLLPAGELPRWMAALQAIPDHHRAMWHELAGVGREQVDELVQATGQALDGRRLTREELARPGRGTAGGAMGAPATGRDVGRPAGAGGACRGAVLWASPRRQGHLRARRPVDRRLAPAGAARGAAGGAAPVPGRLWADHPAGVRALVATTPATARQLLAQLGKEVVEVDVARQRAWLLAEDLEEPLEVAREVVRLLPRYDCFVVGSRPRDQLVLDAADARIRSYRRGRLEGVVALPTLLVDGLVTGIWERRTRGRRIQLTVEATTALTAGQHRRLEAEAARVGAFFGADASLAIGVLR